MTPYEAAYAIGEAKENFCDKTNETNYPMDFYAHDSLGMIFIVITGTLNLFTIITRNPNILYTIFLRRSMDSKSYTKRIRFKVLSEKWKEIKGGRNMLRF